MVHGAGPGFILALLIVGTVIDLISAVQRRYLAVGTGIVGVRKREEFTAELVEWPQRERRGGRNNDRRRGRGHRGEEEAWTGRKWCDKKRRQVKSGRLAGPPPANRATQLQEHTMSRFVSVLLFIISSSMLSAAATPAQMQLQGRSQYGGLLRNVNSQKCIDVFGGSTSKNANVQQYACNGGANQRWEFIDLGNGQFAIRNVNSGLVLDVAGDNRGNGANLQQFPWNGGANQRWYARGSNSNFELVNVNSGKCLDVQGGGMGNNVNIVQWQCNGGRNQRWYAGYAMPGGPGGPGGPGYPSGPGVPPPPPPGMGGGPTGARQFTGMILNVGSRKCVDVYGDSRRPGANVQQFGCNGGANQKWVFITVGRGEYVIQNVNSNMVLEVAGGSRGNGGNVQQNTWNSGTNQRWRGRGPNNNFELVNVNSGKCMDVQGGGNANNTNIIQYDCNGGSNQRWYIGYAH